MTTRVDQLTAATSIASTDLLVVEQGNVLKQATPALLPFAPSGTGAVERTAQTKLREEMVSVKDYGATGDGVTDDRTAFVNAATAANGRKVLVPRPISSYKIGSTLTFAETDRLYFEEGATFTTTTPTGGLWEHELADATATGGSVMKIERLFESASVRLRGRASLWANKTGTMFGVSKEFTASDGEASAPSSALAVQAVNTLSPADVVSILAIAMAKGANCVVYGQNIVVTNAAGSSAPKMIGMEIDIEPSAGVTPAAGSGGLFFNVFNSVCPGPAIQMNGVSSGTWANGIAISGIASNGAGLFGNGGSMDTLINGGSSTYTTAAINLGADGRIKFPATQNPSSDANTLDDYEEATWTVVFTCGTPGDLAVTYSIQTGTVTKVGRRVDATFVIGTSAFTWSTSSGNVQITGWPYTPLTLTSHVWISAVRWAGVTKAGITDLCVRLTSNSTTALIQYSASAAAVANLVIADFPSGGSPSLATSMSYETA